MVIIQPNAAVKGSQIFLGDIANVSARDAGHEALIKALKEVLLADAPPPTMNMTIPGGKILNLIEEAGISLDSIGYSVPQAVKVERIGRVLNSDEVLNTVREELAKDPSFDLQVREVSWASSQVVPAGEAEIKVERLGLPNAGKVPLRIAVIVDRVPAARFVATAVVDDWREVPVTNRPLERGALISPEDVQLVRLNLFKQPSDVAAGINEVVGRRVKSSIAAGETVRKSVIDIPPLVPRGKKLIMVFDSGSLKATATGIAVEDGFEGSEIQVKNEHSRKIVRATVKDADTVEVKVQ